MRASVFHLIIISFLSLDVASASNEKKSCNDILSNQIETTVRDLAKLRFDLDLQLSQGKESIVTRSLIIALEHKQTEALSAFASNGMTSELLKSKIQNEIKRIQGEDQLSQQSHEILNRLQEQEVEDTKTEVTILGDLPLFLENSTQLVLSEKQVLLVGGSGSAAKKTVFLFNPQDQKIRSILTLKGERSEPNVLKLRDGSILVAGGGSEEIELISADLKTVSTVGIGPDHMLNLPGEGLLEDGTVLWITHETFKQPLMTYQFHRFDPSTKQLTSLGETKGMDFGKTITIYPNGKVIVSGGISADPDTFTHQGREYSRSIEEIDVFALGQPDKWYTPFQNRKLKRGVQKVAELENAVFLNQHILLLDGRILIVGGSTLGSQLVTDVGIYDPIAKIYKKIGDLNRQRGFAVLTLLKDGRVLVVGGTHGGYSEASIEVIHPDLETVTEIGSLNDGRYNHAVVVVSDREVIVLGGIEGEGPDDSGSLVKTIEKIKIGLR